MEPEFITFRKFTDSVLANELVEQMAQHHIKYYMEENLAVINPLLAYNNDTSIEYSVKIKAADFERVNKFLKDNEGENINAIDKGYYLFDFTDDELIDLLSKADEWSSFDVALAQKILTERGKSVDEETISSLNKKRLEELKKTDPPQTFWIFLGYLAGIAGGILGIFIGWHLASFKKTLPDGERIYGYNENDRRHGKRIFYLSIIVFAVYFIYRMAQMFK